MSYALVIDDNRQTADLLCQLLATLDIDARPAYGASQGMTLLGNITPRAVFLDINMPGVDGFEILAYLRREPRLVNVPVIIVTSDDQPETSERALRDGARAVVLKPVLLDPLEDALAKAGLA
jgi:CheY-like chemotaxis protein